MVDHIHIFEYLKKEINMTNIKDFADKNGFINWGRYQAIAGSNPAILTRHDQVL